MKMRTEVAGQRQATRLRWWQEVLEGVERPNAPTWDQLLDETVRLRFHVGTLPGACRDAEAGFAAARSL